MATLAEKLPKAVPPSVPLRPPLRPRLEIIHGGKTETLKDTKGAKREYELEIYEDIKNLLTPEEQKYFETIVKTDLEAKPKMEDFSYQDREQDFLKLRRYQRETMAKMSSQAKAAYIRSKIFESRMSRLVELNDWLGNDALLTETSEYDDWLNHVDSVAEFGNLGLWAALDFTTASDITAVHKKIANILMAIDEGTLGKAKYFVFQKSGKKAPLYRLPFLIVAVSPRTVEKLITRKEQENSWVRYAIIIQMLRQIDYFENYIKRQIADSAKQQVLLGGYEKLRKLLWELKKRTANLEGVKITDEFSEERFIEKVKILDPAIRTLLDSVAV